MNRKCFILLALLVSATPFISAESQIAVKKEQTTLVGKVKRFVADTNDKVKAAAVVFVLAGAFWLKFGKGDLVQSPDVLKGDTKAPDSEVPPRPRQAHNPGQQVPPASAAPVQPGEFAIVPPSVAPDFDKSVIGKGWIKGTAEYGKQRATQFWGWLSNRVRNEQAAMDAAEQARQNAAQENGRIEHLQKLAAAPSVDELL
jgi:hypothetical protein